MNLRHPHPHAPEDTFTSQFSLEEHFRDHGQDFDAESEADYARLAREFYEFAESRGIPSRTGRDGVRRVYDAQTETFGVYAADGRTISFYKIDLNSHSYATNQDYFDAQEDVRDD